MPRKNSQSVTIEFSPGGYARLKEAAGTMTLAEYIRRAVAHDMQGQGLAVSADDLRPGTHGGYHKAVRQIIGISTERVGNVPPGQLTGVLAPASQRDRYRARIGKPWTNVDYADWQYGEPVYAFNLHGQSPFEQGDKLEMEGLDNSPKRYAVIRQIRKIDGATITAEDMALLGFADRADWDKHGLNKRRGWLMIVEMLPDTSPSDSTTTHQVNIMQPDGTTQQHTIDTSRDTDD
ncbi:MAG: hypothetical protein IT324_30365 [Anaerolineae bacterium]|nr:hypothetical protein [Anaerolineae bacterium]